MKPFTARELLARVSSHISMERLRQEFTAKERELRTKAERAESQYRAILESISEGFIYLDREWNVLYANEQVAALGGAPLSSILGKTLWDAFPGSAESPFAAIYRGAMESGEVSHIEAFYEPTGRWIRSNLYPSPEGLSIFAQDVTERRIQQEKLLLTEKLAATGRLAATIAHEINNPLESVLNLVYLARTSRAEISRIREYLETAEKELTASPTSRGTLWASIAKPRSPPTSICPRCLKKCSPFMTAASAPRQLRFGATSLSFRPSARCAASSTRSSRISSRMPSMRCAKAES